MTTRPPALERLHEDFHWTARQRQVLDLLAKDRSNAEIAAELGISLDGAKWHVREVLTKLSAESRDEAAEYWRAYNGWRLRFSRVVGGALGSLSSWKAAAAATAVAAATAGAIAIVVALNSGSPGSTVSPVTTALTSTATTALTPAATLTATPPSPPSLPSPPNPLPPAPEPTTRVRLVNVDGSGEREVPVDAHAQYAWSPDGATIAEFSGDYGLVLVDVATGTRSQVYAHPVVQAAWRPDSKAIAVADYESVRILSIVGDRIENRVQIEREGRIPLRGWDIAWSPDGGTFAANAYGEDIVIIASDSKRTIEGSYYGFEWIGPEQLVGYSAPTEKAFVTLVRVDAVSGDSLASFDVPAMFQDVSISPDGSFVAYSQWRSGYDFETFLQEWGTSEGFLFEAARLSNPHQPYQFTPDGDGILVVTNLCEEDQGLAIARRDGSVQPLSDDFVMVAKFSPDGTRLGYTSGLALHVVSADGDARPVLLATDVHGPAGLEWSPDGSTIAISPIFGGFGACE